MLYIDFQCSRGRIPFHCLGDLFIYIRNGLDYFGYNNRNIHVYYRVNASGAVTDLDLQDMTCKLESRDEHCKRDKAGRFRWSGSAGFVGKCTSGARV